MRGRKKGNMKIAPPHTYTHIQKGDKKGMERKKRRE
jgi:hypothetical protein